MSDAFEAEVRRIAAQRSSELLDLLDHFEEERPARRAQEAVVREGTARRFQRRADARARERFTSKRTPTFPPTRSKE